MFNSMEDSWKLVGGIISRGINASFEIPTYHFLYNSYIVYIFEFYEIHEFGNLTKSQLFPEKGYSCSLALESQASHAAFPNPFGLILILVPSRKVKFKKIDRLLPCKIHCFKFSCFSLGFFPRTFYWKARLS